MRSLGEVLTSAATTFAIFAAANWGLTDFVSFSEGFCQLLFLQALLALAFPHMGFFFSMRNAIKVWTVKRTLAQALKRDNETRELQHVLQDHRCIAIMAACPLFLEVESSELLQNLQGERKLPNFNSKELKLKCCPLQLWPAGGHPDNIQAHANIQKDQEIIVQADAEPDIQEDADPGIQVDANIQADAIDANIQEVVVQADAIDGVARLNLITFKNYPMNAVLSLRARDIISLTLANLAVLLISLPLIYYVYHYMHVSQISALSVLGFFLGVMATSIIFSTIVSTSKKYQLCAWDYKLPIFQSDYNPPLSVTCTMAMCACGMVLGLVSTIKDWDKFRKPTLNIFAWILPHASG